MQCLRRSSCLRGLLALPVLLLAMTSSSYLASRCGMSGAVMPSSCCPLTAPGARQPVVAQSSLNSGPCCHSIFVSLGKAPAAPGQRNATDLLPGITVAIAMLPGFDVVPAPSRRGAARAERPPLSAAPRFLLTHAFLI